MMAWPIIENIITLLLACGLATGFFIYTGSAHSFWWLLLLLNMNSPKSGSRKP
jgi:hypothetical protein